MSDPCRSSVASPKLKKSRLDMRVGIVSKSRKLVWFVRVELPITNLYPITKHLFKSLSSVLYFERFKMLWERYVKL
jgi:hypothetical protein